MNLSDFEKSDLIALDRLLESLPKENCVFTTQSVCFVMISQYLSTKWSLSQGLRKLIEKGDKILGNCRRTRLKLHSRNTSGLSQARKKIPKDVFQDMILNLFEQITDNQPKWHGRQVVVIDGTTIQLEPTASLRNKYTPATNQFGSSPFPVAFVTVAHDLMTGAAFEPEIGPMYGEQREAEVNQASRIYKRLDPLTVVVSDRAHGIRFMVQKAIENQLDVVFRLTQSRAKPLLGGDIKAGIDKQVIWTPSRFELRKYPTLKADDHLLGRIITKRIKENGKWTELIIFTTLLEIPKEDIFSLYAKRWQVEGEIRDLKKTIGLSEIKARTEAMVEKEILAAIVAYNLTRAVILLAAKAHKIENPKTLSFKNTLVMLSDYSIQMLGEENPGRRILLFEQMLSWSASYINYPRVRKSYPRKVHMPTRRYPAHSALPIIAEK